MFLRYLYHQGENRFLALSKEQKTNYIREKHIIQKLKRRKCKKENGIKEFGKTTKKKRIIRKEVTNVTVDNRRD